MSLFTPAANADQESPLFAEQHDNASEAHRNENQFLTDRPINNMAGTGGGINTDISATQKMISATWGSVLTSLLGEVEIEV